MTSHLARKDVCCLVFPPFKKTGEGEGLTSSGTSFGNSIG